MKSLKEIAKKLKISERNKVLIEVKAFGIAIYTQTCSVMRRTAEILLETHPATHSAVHGRVKKFEEKATSYSRRKQRNVTAVDGYVFKENRKRYHVPAAMDVDRSETILTRAHTTRGYQIARSLIEKVPARCENRPKLVIDGVLWLKKP